jgi:thiamine biosynthesis lipoprotein
MHDIVIEGTQVWSRNPAVQLDLGGYAKGYALDLAVALLRKNGIHNALINIGGNIAALGERGNRPWRIGVQHPRKPGALATLDLYDGEFVGTSGDYQRYFELDGRRYCHIIDPRTGLPASGVQSVTIVVKGGDHPGALSDAGSKPLFIAGPAGWREAASRMRLPLAMLVDNAGEVYLTRALAKRITPAEHTVLHEVP